MIAAGHCVRAMNGKSIPSPFLWGKGKRQINSLATSENNMLDWLKFLRKCLTSRRQEKVEVAEMYSVGGVKVAQTRFSSNRIIKTYKVHHNAPDEWWVRFQPCLLGSTTLRWNLQSGLFFRFRTISNSYHTKYRSEDKCSAAQKFKKSLSFWYVTLNVREQK